MTNDNSPHDGWTEQMSEQEPPPIGEGDAGKPCPHVRLGFEAHPDGPRCLLCSERIMNVIPPAPAASGTGVEAASLRPAWDAWQKRTGYQGGNQAFYGGYREGIIARNDALKALVERMRGYTTEQDLLRYYADQLAAIIGE